MAAYLTGYSLMILIIYALLSYLLWILSNSFNLQSNVANHFIYAIAITLLIYSVLEFLYFFPFAASMSLLASVLMIFSTIVAKKKQST
jgi:hypothetical protein